MTDNPYRRARHAQPSRRSVLTALGLGSAALLAGCGRSPKGQPMSAPKSSAVQPVQHHYGPDESQHGDLYRPSGASLGTVVVIHGGFWLAEYNSDLGASLSSDLAGRGYTAWNLEYRRVGNGGGWPQTFEDIAAGIDQLSTLDLDTTRVVALGHSAGGQLAAWAAARPKLPGGAPGHDPAVRITGVVSQAGVLDLARAADERVGGMAVPNLLGGSPQQQPTRYAQASPQQQIPLAVPLHCVHGDADQNVPISQSTGYVGAATAAGATAELHRVHGDHFTLIDVSSPAWQTILGIIRALTTG